MVTFHDPDSTGVQVPQNPKEYADLITIFRQRSSDISDSYVKKNSDAALNIVNAAMIVMKNSFGDVVVTSSSAPSAYRITHISTDLDGKTGTALRLHGPSGGQVAIQNKESRLSRIVADASVIELNGSTVVQGNLAVTGTLSTGLATAVKNAERTNSAGTGDLYWSNTSSAFVAMDWMTVNFTAPPSGIELITISAVANCPAGYTYLGTRLDRVNANGSLTNVAAFAGVYSVVWAPTADMASGVVMNSSTTFPYTGLVDGANYRLTLGYMSPKAYGHLQRLCVIAQPTI